MRLMAINVREVERDQLFLMPPVGARLATEDHLAWFIDFLRRRLRVEQQIKIVRGRLQIDRRRQDPRRSAR